MKSFLAGTDSAEERGGQGVTDPGALGYRGSYIIIQFKNFYVIIQPLHYLKLSLIETILTKNL